MDKLDEILDTYSHDVQSLIAGHTPFKDSVEAPRWQAEARQRIIAWAESVIGENEFKGGEYQVATWNTDGYEYYRKDGVKNLVLEARDRLRADQRKKLSDTSKGGE